MCVCVNLYTYINHLPPQAVCFGLARYGPRLPSRLELRCALSICIYIYMYVCVCVNIYTYINPLPPSALCRRLIRYWARFHARLELRRALSIYM